jgi:hypothetical protein
MYVETNEPEPARNALRRSRYESCIEASKQVRWDLDKDLLRGRQIDFATTFLPDGLSKVGELPCLVERFINAKVLEVSRDHWLGDQKALEALVRFSDEELKHQELFRRLEQMIGAGMPAGYHFRPQPDEVAAAVLSKSTWSVLALICHIELFTQTHFRQSIEPTAGLSSLFKDVFLFHWMEESQHAILDELEWRREDGKLTEGERDRAVDDFISLVGAVDGLLQMQAAADATYFLQTCSGRLGPTQSERVRTGVLRAYRWQYILSGAQLSWLVCIVGYVF